eukprot:TRINITY_DN5949_c0_g1_i1.p1 TRINITY_DN5949_c0_g1~~TRINITY_DN5949_c0_g1_i1.p1  ORF type:complete len:188 (+),score=46.03 TRINITY_DN5949_c0_g1_i1:79-642(+)
MEDFSLKQEESKKSATTRRKEREQLENKREELKKAPPPQGVQFGFIHQIIYTNYNGPIIPVNKIPIKILSQITESRKYLFLNCKFKDTYVPSSTNTYNYNQSYFSSPYALVDSCKKSLLNMTVEGAFEITLFGKNKQTVNVRSPNIITIIHSYNENSICQTSFGFAFSEEIIRKGGQYYISRTIQLK